MGEAKFVIMFGGLHIEMAMWKTFLLCNTLFYDDMRFMYVCFDILMLHRDVSDPPCAKADSFRQSAGWMDKPKDIWHVKNL